MRRFDLTPVLLLLPLFIALLPDGLPNTADMHVHFIRAAEMVHAWQDGVWLPRWSANLGYGYGIPLFNYAPPLPYLLTAFFHTVGLPLETALKATLIVALLLTSWGSYVLFRSSFGQWAGMVGSVTFVYAPYRLRELFIQGNVGQLMAWAFIPWAVWGVGRLWATGRLRYGIVTALAMAGALLSHNVVALVLGGVLALQTIGLLICSFFSPSQRSSPAPLGRGQMVRLSKVALAGMGGVALAAWFSLPALLEGDLIQLDKIVASDYRTRFVPFQELIALSPPLDRAAINPYLPLTLGAVPVGLAVTGGIVLFIGSFLRRTATRPPTPARNGEKTTPFPTHLRKTIEGGGYLLLALFGAFMAHNLSLPLWEQLPFVDLFEFPARWHGFTALGLAGLAGAFIYGITNYRPNVGAWVAGLSFFLLLLASLVNLYPQRLSLGTLKATPADVVQFEISTGAVGTTSLAEFNPVWRTLPLTDSPLIEDYRANRTPERIEQDSLPSDAIAETVESGTEFHRLRITLNDPATITLNLLYFPGWTAFANGIAIPVRPQAETGLAQLVLPAGTHEIEVRFEDTPLRQGSEWLSWAAWLTVAGLIGWKVLRYWKGRGVRQSDTATHPPAPSQEGSIKQNTGVVLTALVPILLLYFAVPAYFAPTSPPDSAASAPVPLRAEWGAELRLLGVEVPGEVIKAGDTVSVVAYVRALYPLNEDYAVYLHLDDPTGQTVATSDQRHPAEIPTSNLPPTLYLRIPFRITIPDHLPPMNYTWRLGWHDPDSGTLLPFADGQKDALLGEVWVESRSSVQPTGETATFGEAIHLRGATLNRAENHLTLYWEPTAPTTEELTIFVHLFDSNGQMVGQADGDPFDNRYRLSAWRVGHLFAETRFLPAGVPYESIAIGIYRRADGVRLPALDANGNRLINDAMVIRDEP